MSDRAKGWVCLDVQLDSSQNVCVCVCVCVCGVCVWGGGAQAPCATAPLL